jgi:hypothetical protein
MLESNMQFIEYAISIEDTEQQFGAVSIAKTNVDFFVALEAKSYQLNFNSLPANESAIAFVTKHSQNLFVMREEGEAELLTTIHFVEFNGFLAISEVIHTLLIEEEAMLKIKASIEKNKAEKFKLITFPTADFFNEINHYKLGGNGKSMSSKLKFVVNYEF